MELLTALRLASPSPAGRAISLAGAGGKSTALFQMARQYLRRSIPRVVVTATSHLAKQQIAEADHHIVATAIDDLINIDGLNGIILVTGGLDGDRSAPIDGIYLNWLRESSETQNIPFLIEADGSRMHPVKAPASHEPPIPEFSDMVIVLAGLRALGMPLAEEHVHRPEIFSRISGLSLNMEITPDSLIRILTSPQGGLKNIPPTARRVVFLNQADTPEIQSVGGEMAGRLIEHFDSVVVGSLKLNQFQTIENTAGIILAAGESKRFGAPKQLLDWRGKPFVRHIAETALHAGLQPVIIVLGHYAAEVESALSGLPVQIVHNAEYQQGQSTSIKKGIETLPSNAGSAVFLLADQPQIPSKVLQSLAEAHARELPAILAPLVLEERRANPVLFDRIAFPDLLQLTGDIGGRAVFDKHRLEYLPWHDDSLLLDVDDPQDYQRLKELE